MNRNIYEKPILTPVGIIKCQRVVKSIVKDIIYLNGLKNNDVDNILNILYIFEAIVYRWDNEIETAQKKGIDINNIIKDNYNNYMELLKYFNLWNEKTEFLLKELSEYFEKESILMNKKIPCEEDIYNIQKIRSADCFLLHEIFKILNKKNISDLTLKALRVFYCIDEYEDDLHSIEKDRLENEFNSFIILKNILGDHNKASICFRKKINDLLNILINYLSKMKYKERFRMIQVILNYNYESGFFHTFLVSILTIFPNSLCKRYLVTHFDKYHNKHINFKNN